jgi:hypothetical protein
VPSQETCHQTWEGRPGGFTCCFVVNDIPVLDGNSILQANHVRGDPVRWQSDVGESAMNDDIVATWKNQARLIAKHRGRGLGEIEEAVTAGGNISAVLDVVGRPVPLGRGIVAPVEQCVECFEDTFLVFRFGLIHCSPGGPSLASTLPAPDGTAVMASGGPFSSS